MLLEQGKYEMAAFNLEQAIQFQLKYFIGIRLGQFDKTHLLRSLFRDSIELCPKLRTLYENNIDLIGDIESAYIMSRYFDTKYEEVEVRKMIDFYKILTGALSECV